MNANVKKFLETDALAYAENGKWHEFYEELNLSGLSIDEAHECLQILTQVGLVPDQATRKAYVIRYLMDGISNYFDQTGLTTISLLALYTDCNLLGYSTYELAQIVRSNAYTLSVIVHDDTDPTYIVLEDSI